MSSHAITIGQEFGRLTVIQRAGLNKVGRVEYIARCECGNIIAASRADLFSGEVFSCGCPVKIDEAKEPALPFSFDYTVVEFTERRVGGKVQAVARDGRILDERPIERDRNNCHLVGRVGAPPDSDAARSIGVQEKTR